jgi:hypothetical protein
VTRKLNKNLPNFWKKWPKIPKYEHQSCIESPSLKIHTTNQVLKVLVWVKIGCVKSSLNGENFAQTGHTDCLEHLSLDDQPFLLFGDGFINNCCQFHKHFMCVTCGGSKIS